MRVNSRNRLICNRCGSTDGTPRHIRIDLPEAYLCQGCSALINKVIDLLVNRSHSEILGRLGLTHPDNADSRNIFYETLKECVVKMVISGIREFSTDPIEKPVLSPQTNLFTDQSE